MALFLILTAKPLLILELRFRNVCELNFPSSTNNITVDNKVSGCSIPYDQCRCAGALGRFRFREKCISDGEAIAGHVMPLIIYAQALYLCYKLVSFTGKYRHILTDMFWIIALLIFTMIAIAVHGSSCFYYYTATIISIVGVLLGVVLFCLFVRGTNQYQLRATLNTNLDQRLTTDNWTRSHYHESLFSNSHII